jgi:hypothetical protein
MINYKLKTEAVPFGQEFERIGVSSSLIFHLSFIIVLVYLSDYGYWGNGKNGWNRGWCLIV